MILAEVSADPLWIFVVAATAAIGKMWLEVRSLDKAHLACEVKYATLEGEMKLQKAETDNLRQDFEAWKAQHYSRINDDGAWMSANEGGLIVLWSPAMTELLGFTEEEVLGQPVFNIIPERFHQLHHEQLSAIVSGHKKMSRHLIENSFARTKGGGEIPVTTEVRSYKPYVPGTQGFQWFFRITLERRVLPTSSPIADV